MILRPLFGAAVSLCAGALPTLAETASYDKVISSVTLSFSDDGSADRAVLVANSDAGADLYIYRGVDNDGDKPLQPALVKKDIAWNGAVWGQRPSLDANSKGSLVVKSENDAIGRDRWSQTMTIVYRNNEFLVAGLSYEVRDTLDPKAGGNCDINFLTGKGTRNGKAIEAKFGAIKLIDWNDDKTPKECRF